MALSEPVESIGRARRRWRARPSGGHTASMAHGNERQPSLATQMEVAIGWFPHWANDCSDLSDEAVTLRQRLPTLLPALIYGDAVTVVCPESDDVMEMHDYGEVYRAANGGNDEYLGERSRFQIMSLEAGYPSDDDDDEESAMEPLVPDVWIEHAEGYRDDAKGALTAGDREAATTAVARFLALSWGVHDYGGEEVIREQVPEADDALLSAARDRVPHVMGDVQPPLLLDSFCALADQPGVYPIVDDIGGALDASAREHAADVLRGWAQMRSAEATLAAALLRDLPSPRTDQPWDVAVDIRAGLSEPLARFRRALAAISAEAPSHPLELDFAEYAAHVWRTRIDPALDELSDLVRQATLREVFFHDVAGDLSTYAGPALGLASAMTSSLPDVVSAAVSLASPVMQTYSHARQRRRDVAKHEFLFLYEAGKRLRRR
jgi:hypothetical protein